MSEDTNAVDDYAADVFDGVAETTDVMEPEITSWEDAESYVAPEPSNDEEVTEKDDSASEESPELFEKDGSEDSEGSPEPKSEDDVEESSDSDESGEEGEAEAFELPEQLTEKGLVQSEEGELGKYIKVDGEDTFVSLEELGNDYSGQQAISKRFNEINADKQAHQQEVNEVNSYINTFGEKMKEGDSLSAIQYMGEFAGVPPYQIKRQLMEQLRPEMEKMYELSAPELQAQYAQEENEYLKQSIESEKEASNAKQAQEALQTEISTVRETHNIEDTEWDQAITYLQEHEAQLRAQDPNLVMDANFVADVVNDSRAYSKAESALQAADVDLSVESNSELLNHLHEVAYNNPDFDNDDLVELVNAAKKNAVEEKAKTSLAKRVEKHGSSPARAKEETKTELSPEESDLLEDIWG